MALKELEVRYAAERSRDHKLSDGEGLHLLVRPHGAKLWRLKYRFDGREKLLSFGGYPEVSLAQARLRRAEAKVALAEGPEHVMAFATIQSGKEHLCQTSLSSIFMHTSHRHPVRLSRTCLQSLQTFACNDDGARPSRDRDHD